MKKLIFVIAASLIAFGASAQTEKGSWRLGGNGNIGYNNTKFDGAKATNSFNLGVDGGYFVIDGLSINAGVGVNYAKAANVDGTTNFNFNVGARYYLPFNLFFGAAYNLELQNSNSTRTGMGIDVMAGYAWFLNDRVALEPAVSYRIGLTDKDKGTKYNNLAAQIGIGVYF